MITFLLNTQRFQFEGDETTPLLWVLRENAGLKGTKFGCGAGLCGACTVHIDGRAERSCTIPVHTLAGRNVVTIEGLSAGSGPETALHPVQQAWIEEDVAQCGYCQSGQIMAAADWLQRIPNPTDQDIEEQQTNLCRCGTYARVRKAIYRASEIRRQGSITVVEPVAGSTS